MQAERMRAPAPQDPATRKAPRPVKADSFKHAMARAMEGAGPAASPLALRPRAMPAPTAVAVPAQTAVAVPAQTAFAVPARTPMALPARALPTQAWPAQTVPATTDPAFRHRIAVLESGGGASGHLARNAQSGALGRYQMLSVALRDIGWQDAQGNWTELAARHGVQNEAEFLAGAAAQEAAMDAYLRRTELQLDRNGALARAGDAVIGLDGRAVPVTEAGLMAAAHRRGAASVARYLAHRSGAADAPPSRADAQAFAAVERRLRDFADLPYAIAGRAGTTRAG